MKDLRLWYSGQRNFFWKICKTLRLVVLHTQCTLPNNNFWCKYPNSVQLLMQFSMIIQEFVVLILSYIALYEWRIQKNYEAGEFFEEWVQKSSKCFYVVVMQTESSHLLETALMTHSCFELNKKNHTKKVAILLSIHRFEQIIWL